jgi:RNase P/RNase MRP subunit p30
MINTKNINEARKLLKKSKKPIIIKSQNIMFDRKILESGGFDILLFPTNKTLYKQDAASRVASNLETRASYFQTKDHPKYLDSGLNHVMAKIAAKNKIAIGIDVSKLHSLSPKEKAIHLSRIKQNIKVCKKAKCKLSLLNYKDKKDAMNLLLSLGASTKQTKEATAKIIN